MREEAASVHAASRREASMTLSHRTHVRCGGRTTQRAKQRLRLACVVGAGRRVATEGALGERPVMWKEDIVLAMWRCVRHRVGGGAGVQAVLLQ